MKNAIDLVNKIFRLEKYCKNNNYGFRHREVYRSNTDCTLTIHIKYNSGILLVVVINISLDKTQYTITDKKKVVLENTLTEFSSHRIKSDIEQVVSMYQYCK